MQRGTHHRLARGTSLLPREPGFASSSRESGNALSRRALLTSVIAGVATAGLSGCGELTVGEPAPYTPPPPGIDELYRRDLVAALDALDRLCTGATLGLLGPTGGTQQQLGAFPGTIVDGIREYLDAMRTGRENDGARDDSTSARRASALASLRTIAPADLATPLAGLRDLSMQASMQVSSTLAGLTASLTAWSAHTLAILSALAAAQGVALAAPSPATTLGASRTVPTVDPPTFADPSALVSRLHDAEALEHEASYTFEVAAARTSDAARTRLLALVASSNARAELYSSLSSAHGSESAPQEAGYPLPRPLDAGALASARQRLLTASLTHLVAVTSLARPAERSRLVLECEKSGRDLASSLPTLTPLIGLDAQEKGAS